MRLVDQVVQYLQILHVLVVASNFKIKAIFYTVFGLSRWIQSIFGKHYSELLSSAVSCQLLSSAVSCQLLSAVSVSLTAIDLLDTLDSARTWSQLFSVKRCQALSMTLLSMSIDSCVSCQLAISWLSMTPVSAVKPGLRTTPGREADACAVREGMQMVVVVCV